MLDRIDFNVEQACVKTEDGLKQLQKVKTMLNIDVKILIIIVRTRITKLLKCSKL